jgi:hypothetical protein
MAASGNIAFEGTCQQNTGATSYGGDVFISHNSTTYHFSQEKPDGRGSAYSEKQPARSLDQEHAPMQSVGSEKAKYSYHGAQKDDGHTDTSQGGKSATGDGKKRMKVVTALTTLTSLSVFLVNAWLKYSAATSAFLLLL